MNAASPIPRSTCAGALWPAFPGVEAAQLLALQYQLEQSQWWPAAEIERHQLLQMQSVLRHAYRTMPFWHGRLAAAGYAPDRLLGGEQFLQLPLLARGDMHAAGPALMCDAPPAAHGPVHEIKSSGSTGEPVLTHGTGLTRLMWSALLLREHLWHQRDFRGKLAIIRSMVKDAALPDWGPPIRDVFETGRAAVLDVVADIDAQLDWLQREQPDYLLSLATNVHALARRSLELGIHLPQLKEVRTFAESMRPDLRALVMQAWGVRVTDSYSAQELGYIALQCPQAGHYHVQSESLLVEVINERGLACVPGEIGRVVVSTLHNFSTPLIRYVNGDYAEVGAPCACGRGLPVLTRILGRQRNMIVLPDGKRHWPSFPLSLTLPVAPVRQLQLVQDRKDHVEARLVLEQDLTPGQSSALIKVLQKSLGYPFHLTLRRVREIPRNAGNKYEDFMTLLDS